MTHLDFNLKIRLIPRLIMHQKKTSKKCITIISGQIENKPNVLNNVCDFRKKH